MYKFIMDYYGAQCYRSIQKNRPIDNIIISWQITNLFFIFNFQSIFFTVLIIIKKIFKNPIAWLFFERNLFSFMIFFGIFSLLSFIIVYIYITSNKLDKKINPYDYKGKVLFYNIYMIISTIVILVVFYFFIDLN